MATISGFRGFRYNPEVIDNFDNVLAPPYDVISPEQRDELYEKSINNAVRIILTKGEDDAKYKEAADTFNSWINDKVLIRDEEPSVYVYHQVFKEGGKSYTRKGFISAVKIEDFENKKIYPHERTFSHHKADRLKLITASKANLSPVFSVFSDPDLAVDLALENALFDYPLFKSTDNDGVENYLWRVSDPDLLFFIAEKFEDKKLLIADGHHRYETAINYRNLRREQNPDGSGSEPYEYVMMFLSCAEQPGLIVKPTYRLIGNMKEDQINDILSKVENEFEGDTLDIDAGIKKIENSEFGVVTNGLDKLTKIKDFKGKESSELGVVKLHNYLLDSILEDKSVNYKYTKSLDEVMKLLKDRTFQIGFILPEINAVDILNFAETGRRLPQKTTYFYPKVLSGLVFNLLD
ncbi:MAG: DUF1015 domain-containing protein [Candidatus Dadabacteria bacterium]|nr:DUF1015 domain-containing protein [Candidatus Dadabacteria bacterium]NIS09952.1 DUF1015 domain-containing protein [Candidatus Dadabacteria bacterium]NIV41868.1 DUF1015 family protein [Candidatus Dadabacteria bacterium]NIY22927.1 DUF1015 family protein [Candidatus Dadabacteria bacterium]